MAAGESQDCSWAARGCVRSLLFVLFSYASKAALRTNWKLEEEEEEEDAIGGFWDTVCIERGLVGGRETEPSIPVLLFEAVRAC